MKNARTVKNHTSAQREGNRIKNQLLNQVIYYNTELITASIFIAVFSFLAWGI